MKCASQERKWNGQRVRVAGTTTPGGIMTGRSVVPRGPDTHNDVVGPNAGGTHEKTASTERPGRTGPDLDEVRQRRTMAIELDKEAVTMKRREGRGATGVVLTIAFWLVAITLI